MKPFEEVYKIVEESSHETAFNREECEAIYDLLIEYPSHEPLTIVEVGVQYGRSMSVFAEFQKDAQAPWHLVGVDDWSCEKGQEAHDHFLSQKEKHGWKVDLWSMDSVRASEQFDKKIDILHIDADYMYTSVLIDCNAWLSKVKIYGMALFDDYGHPGFEGVKEAINDYMAANPQEKWRKVGVFGNKLAMFERIK